MRYPALALAFLLAACSDSATEPEPPEPGNVVVVSASQVAIFQGARVTVELRNQGGPAVFFIEFWSNRTNVPNGTAPMWAQSEAVEVAADWTETATWEVPTNTNGWPVDVLVVKTRDPGSVTYRETDRHEF